MRKSEYCDFIQIWTVVVVVSQSGLSALLQLGLEHDTLTTDRTILITWCAAYISRRWVGGGLCWLRKKLYWRSCLKQVSGHGFCQKLGQKWTFLRVIMNLLIIEEALSWDSWLVCFVLWILINYFLFILLIIWFFIIYIDILHLLINEK